MKIKSFECPKSIRNYEKKILGTSDAWSTSLWSHRPSEPAYYIVDCRIFSGIWHACYQKSSKGDLWLWLGGLYWCLGLLHEPPCRNSRQPKSANPRSSKRYNDWTSFLDFYDSKSVVFLINLILTELDYRVLSKNITWKLCTWAWSKPGPGVESLR